MSFAFASERVDTLDRTAEFSMPLESGRQVIISNPVNEMRREGVSGIGPASPLAGALFAWVEGGGRSGILIGDRRSRPAPNHSACRRRGNAGLICRNPGPLLN